MLYGKLVFIKRNGEDGSIFPVTSKNIKIGRSKDCIVRIENPHVSPEHCEIIVDENGQANIKNLSNTNPTILNNQLLGNGRFALRQNDFFKLGERYVRWEYTPGSKFYSQTGDESNRLVAVVAPQKRMSEDNGPSNSDTYKLAKRERYSDIHSKVSTGKLFMSKALRLSLGAKRVPHKTKLLSRNSFHQKSAISPAVKTRRSAVFDSSGKPVNEKYISLSKAWEVKALTPPHRKSPERKLVSNRKATPIKVPMTQVCSTSKAPSLGSISETSQTGHSSRNLSETPLKLEKTPGSRNSSRKSVSGSNKTRKSIVKQIDLNDAGGTPSAKSITPSIIRELPSTLRTGTPIKTPAKNSPVTLSARKMNLRTSFAQMSPLEEKPEETLSKTSKLTPVKMGGTSVKKRKSEAPPTSKQTPAKFRRTGSNRRSALPITPTEETSANIDGTSVKKRKSVPPPTPKQTPPKVTETIVQKRSEDHTTPKQIPAKVAETSVKKAGSTAPNTQKQTPVKVARTSVIKKRKSVPSPMPKRTPAKLKETSVKKRKSVSTPSPKQSPAKVETSVKKRKPAIPVTPKQTPAKVAGSSAKTRSATSLTPPPSKNRQTTAAKRSPYVKKTPKTPTEQLSLPKTTSPVIRSAKKKKSMKGVNRRLLDISSAERAAKKLKTIKPTKPDKNKKAALLVLGKASGKFRALQTTKAMKQKIVKKAIMQSTKAKKNTTAAKSTKKPNKNKNKETPSSKKKETPRKSPREASVKSASSEKPSTSKESPKTVPMIKTDSSALAQSPIPSKSQTSGKRSLASSPKSNASISSSLEALNTSVPSMSAVKTPVISDLSPLSPLSSFSPYTVGRRASKRLMSQDMKNFDRPDFTELTPTVLGLAPRNLGAVFKTSLANRNSLSLETPPNKGNIVQSVSTSKIHRKSVRFAINDAESPFRALNFSSTTALSDIRTPNVSLDFFVSPLSNSDSQGGKSKTPRSIVKSAQRDMSFEQSESGSTIIKETTKKGNTSPRKVQNSRKSPRNDLTDVKGVRQLMKTPREQKSPKNDLTDVKGVRQLMKTPREQKSPKNDLTDVKGVRQLMKTPREQKSPKNDLTDVKGVRQLMKTPREQKSPKNDLTDVKGVRQLMKTPREQKSPKNDLTDVKGVRQLMKTPREQKSPKNDLTDVKGVRQLMKTPREQKSPKNDLTDVKGVRQLMKTPREQKSPKNDLTDVKGVRQLMKTPREQKSPKNDLTDVKGVRQLMKTPREQKSPKNDLTDVKGVRQLMKTPREQKSPKNDLTDVKGVRQLMKTPREQKSPKNDLTDVRGVKTLMVPPKPQKSPRNDLLDVRGVKRLMSSPIPRKSPRNDLTDVTGVKQLLITKSPRNDLSNVSLVESLFKSPPSKIQCLRTLYHPVEEKVEETRGVQKLLSMSKGSDLDISLTGVAEFFLSPKKRRLEVEGPEVKALRLSDGSSEEAVGKGIKTKAERKTRARGTAAESMNSSDEPTVTTRSTRAQKSAGPPAVSPVAKRTRMKTEREEEGPKSSGRNTRTTRKVAAKKESPPSSPEVVKTRVTRTRKSVAVDSPVVKRTRVKLNQEPSVEVAEVKRTRRAVSAAKKETPPKRTRSAANGTKSEETSESASKAKKEVESSPESKPSPIRRERKSIAKSSLKTARSTRSRAKVVKVVAPAKAKAKRVTVTSVSPVKTRQRKEKASSPKETKNAASQVKTRQRKKTEGSPKESKSSPVRRRQRAK